MEQDPRDHCKHHSYPPSNWLKTLSNEWLATRKDSIGLNIAAKRVPIGTLGIWVQKPQSANWHSWRVHLNTFQYKWCKSLN